MNIDGFGGVAHRCHGGVSVCPIAKLSLRRSLLLGMAGAALLAGTAVSLAQPVDEYLLPGGSVSGPVDFVTLFALSGTGEVTANATLTGTGDAPAMVQTGGAMDGTARGLASYSQTGGTVQGQIAYTETFELAGDGTVFWGAQLVGDSGAVFQQSGGTMGGTAQFQDGAGISTYVQTGGDMTGTVITGTYEASGGTIAVNSNVAFSELFALSGDAYLGDIYLYGDGDAAMTQSGGTMGAWVSGIETYTMTGGTILQATEVVTDAFVQSGGTINDITEENDWRATVRFATGYELSGDATIGLANLIGGADATMTQSGGTMGGHVYSETQTETIAQYSQTGGDMTGQVTAETYAASGGNVSGTVNFSELFALSGDAVVNEGYLLNGDGDALMTQSGGTMAGAVRGIATYEMSGGTVTGEVSYTDHFEFSGGEIGWVDIWGGADATMTQTGGTMSGWVRSTGGDGFIEKYTQTGGDMNLYVTARNYEMSGGTLNDGVDVSELFDLQDGTVTSGGYLAGQGTAAVTQSGGAMGGEIFDVIDYTQSGGTMTNYVATGDYALSGGSISGHVDFTDLFALSASGEVLAGATISGDTTAQMTQSGGSMSGHVNGNTNYTQSGGAMGGAVNAQTYALSGGTLSGTANFGTSFALSGIGSVTEDGKLVGDGSATATQSGGAMDGTVTGVTSYTQSGGAMSGTVNAQTYALSGGTLSGTANFGTSVTLSGTGEVTAAGKLVGDGSATMTQSGGVMDGTVTGITSYTQSAGAMGGKVTAATYTMSGGTLTGEAAGFSNFVLSGSPVDVVVTGTLVGASGSTVTQNGGKMNGNVSGIANYIQKERVGSAAVISFSRLYELVDGQVDVGAKIIGGAGSAMTQTGPGKMQGAVSGVSTYTQSAGTMNGSVSTGTYTLSSGTVSETVNFSSAFTLGTGQVNGSAKLIGGAGSTMTQSGGSMKGSVSGVTSYSQTAGDMGAIQANTNAIVGKVSTATYNLSGGTVAGLVDFSSLFTLSGTGTVTATATLTGAANATMNQSAGTTMGGTVASVGSYAQSGGSVTGAVTAGTYSLSGGSLTGATNFSTLFALDGTGAITSTATLTGGANATMTQAAGTAMDGTVASVGSYAQSGGTMRGKVTAGSYELSGGSVDGEVGFSALALSGTGSVSATGKLIGSSGSTLMQSAGTMGGTIASVGTYAQSGGSLTGTTNFSTLFALDGTGTITSTATLTGGASSTMTQAAGTTMGGTVASVGSYTQSGGSMNGEVTASSYELTGGSVDGEVGFSNFTLSGTGSVSSSGKLTGGTDSGMTQAAGTMAGTVTGVSSYTQSGGGMSGVVTSDSYSQSGGSLTGTANIASLFALSGTGSVSSTARLIGDGDAHVTQTGGSMNGTLAGVGSYSQSGGSMGSVVTLDTYDHSGGSVGGTINAATYRLTGAGATSSGTIIASSAFNLGFDTGTATVGAKLSGAGKLVKTGLSTVVITNAANDFSGGVAVDGGVLEVQNDALPETPAITVGADATLRFNVASGISTTFNGDMTGAGTLDKVGLGAMTLGGDIHLGALLVNAGVLNIGNGAPEEASFESAYIGVGATVYVAEGATLRIRIPKTIANFGTLINDGTVYDDLDNAGWFQNNALYVANLASNTHDIHNNLRWEGNVLTNNGWIFNNDDATWVGDIVSNAAVDSRGRPGRIANGGGTWRGNIFSNAGHIINDNIADESDFGYWFGDIYSNTNWIFNGGGGIWEGDVISNAGQIDNGKSAIWTGDVRSNASWLWSGGVWNGKVLGNTGLVWNAGGTWNGNVEANTGLIQNIAGRDADGPTGGSTWVGDVVTNAGTILNAADSTWSGNVLSNSGTIQNLGLWSGNFSNAGTVAAQNRIVGAFANAGTLRVTGNLAGITTLTNSGTIDMTGGGSQVLSVGTATFASGSFLDVQIDPNGQADQVAVTGVASLGGTVRVSSGGPPHNNGPFTIVTAGSISGTFDAVTTDLAFFATNLSYGAQSVSVAIQRNDRGFSETGVTGNQMATGAAVEALGAGNALYDAVLWLTQAEAQSAFSQLSGEPHASQASGAVQGASAIGQMAGNRVDQAFAALDDGATQVSAYTKSLTPMPDAQPRSNAIWGQLYGARGSVDAAGGNAGVASSNGGVVIGLDGLVSDWRLGLLLQGGLSDTQVSTLNASASSTDYGLGIYGGREFGDTLLTFGATYTRHDNQTTRQVSFPGFVDKLSASYASGTSQVFANVSHEFDFGAVSIKPYAGLAHVIQATGGFTETGGAAALTSTANVINATFASLGLGVERQFVVGGDMLLTASGSIGWRHAFAETPVSAHRFGTGPSFTITGKPATSDLLTLGTGLALDVGGGTNLDLTYSGQIGGGTQTHALQGIWSQRF